MKKNKKREHKYRKKLEFEHHYFLSINYDSSNNRISRIKAKITIQKNSAPKLKDAYGTLTAQEGGGVKHHYKKQTYKTLFNAWGKKHFHIDNM